MKFSKIFISYLFMLISLLSYAQQPKDAASSNNAASPKNVILIIGDGMGLGSVYSLMAVRDNTAFEEFKHIGFSQTQSADHFTTDSGAGGTAISTGKRTKNKYISIDPITEKYMETMIELCRKKGLQTGVVSACSIVHATPASFLSHASDRDNYELLAENLLPTQPTLFIGGGRDVFEKRTDKKNLTDSLRKQGYTIAYTLDDLLKTENAHVAGLLFAEHPKTAKDGRGNYLPASSQKAMQLLSKNNEKGFFMMIEGSQIDWMNHNNDYAGLIAEMDDFNTTITKVLEFAKNDGNTLVVVTADHETGGLVPLDNSTDYPTVNAKYVTFGHTPTMVPVFAFGPGSEEFCGIYKNTDLHDKIVKLLFENK